MTAATCALCGGTRDVERRTVLEVDLDVCRWCLERYGPRRHMRCPYGDADYRSDAGWDAPTTYADEVSA